MPQFAAAFARSRNLEMDLTPAQWSRLSPLLAAEDGHRRRGRPQQDTQSVINGVFWVLRTGARWSDLPGRYPPHQTCHRRFRRWLDDGTLFACFRLLARDLEEAREAESPTEADAPLPALETMAGLSRSWKWHTALLLRSPLAVQALAKSAAAGGARNEVSAPVQRHLNAARLSSK
jgi:transposase